MNYIDFDMSHNTATIGEKLGYLRRAMGYTQQDFAEAILMSRCSLSKVEKAKSNDDIGYEILFRIFFVVSRISETNQNAYIKNLAERIRNETIETIENKKIIENDSL